MFSMFLDYSILLLGETTISMLLVLKNAMLAFSKNGRVIIINEMGVPINSIKTKQMVFEMYRIYE